MSRGLPVNYTYKEGHPMRDFNKKNTPTEAYIEIIEGYVMNLASKTCYDRSRSRKTSSTCLIDVNIDDTRAKAFVRYMLRFAQMKPSVKANGLTEWIRGSLALKQVAGVKRKTLVLPMAAPTDPFAMEVEDTDDITKEYFPMICAGAVRNIDVGQRAWDGLAVHGRNGTLSKHGLAGKESNRRRGLEAANVYTSMRAFFE